MSALDFYETVTSIGLSKFFVQLSPLLYSNSLLIDSEEFLKSKEGDPLLVYKFTAMICGQFMDLSSIDIDALDHAQKSGIDLSTMQQEEETTPPSIGWHIKQCLDEKLIPEGLIVQVDDKYRPTSKAMMGTYTATPRIVRAIRVDIMDEEEKKYAERKRPVARPREKLASIIHGLDDRVDSVSAVLGPGYRRD